MITSEETVQLNLKYKVGSLNFIRLRPKEFGFKNMEWETLESLKEDIKKQKNIVFKIQDKKNNVCVNILETDIIIGISILVLTINP